MTNANGRSKRWRWAVLPALAWAVTGATTTSVPPVTKPIAEARIEVDLSERKLHVYRGDTRINSFDVAVGTDEHQTPTGEFTIDRIIWNPAWVPPNVEWAEDATRKEPGEADNPMQGAKLFFKYPDYYIHGTNAPETLGSEASHGCLRMNEVDVENLAEFIQRAGGEDRGDAWFDEVRESDSDRTEVTLPDPVAITIRA